MLPLLAFLLQIFEVRRPTTYGLLKQMADWVERRCSVEQQLAGQGLPMVTGLVKRANLMAALQSEYLYLPLDLACQDDPEMRAQIHLEKQIGIVFLAVAGPELPDKVHLNGGAQVLGTGLEGLVELHLVKLALAKLVN